MEPFEPLYRIDEQRNKLEVRHSLDEKEWDAIIAVMAEKKISGLDASGHRRRALGRPEPRLGTRASGSL